MPNAIGSTGLVTKTQAELIAEFQAAFQAIYGTDINLDPDSPDGQMMMIFIQSSLDNLDLIRQVYNQFDPDTAVGRVLDMRAAINGIQRQAGTHTVTNVSITNNKSITLYGLDQEQQPIYTVADNAGNKWQLLESIVLSVPATTALAFQAQDPGQVQSVPNTITVPITIVLGVTAINNPSTYTTLGINEESDYEFRIRRQKSVSLSSQGYLDGLLAALENIPGVSSAFVYENVTGTTDGDGIPSHSIWVILAGTGAVGAIANAIYTKRNAGCGMKGDQSYGVAQADGTTFFVFWDNVEAETVFIKATLTSLDGINAPDIAAIRAGLVTSFVPAVAEQININDLATQIQILDNNSLVTLAGFSSTSGGAYTNTKSPAAKNKQLTVTAPNIILLPMILNPSAPSVPVSTAAAATFSALGGYGAYTFSIHTNVSGGTINGASGVYNSGATPGTDVVRVTDGLGNTTDVNVTVS